MCLPDREGRGYTGTGMRACAERDPRGGVRRLAARFGVAGLHIATLSDRAATYGLYGRCVICETARGRSGTAAGRVPASPSGLLSGGGGFHLLPTLHRAGAVPPLVARHNPPWRDAWNASRARVA